MPRPTVSLLTSYQSPSANPSPLGFYPLALAILSFIFLICSLRTNLFFFLIFVAATMGFSFATAAFWYNAEGNMALGKEFLVATGGCFWAAAMFGWYLLLAIMIPTMELPIPAPPIVDLSTVIRAKKPHKRED